MIISSDCCLPDAIADRKKYSPRTPSRYSATEPTHANRLQNQLKPKTDGAWLPCAGIEIQHGSSLPSPANEKLRGA